MSMFRIIMIMENIEIEILKIKSIRECRKWLQIIRNKYLRKGWLSVKINNNCIYVLSRDGKHEYKFVIKEV